MTLCSSRQCAARLGLISAAGIAAMACLLPAATASADHRGFSCQPRGGWTISIGGGRPPSSSCDSERIEFQRGSEAGWRDGRSRGYDDGRCGRAFCNDPRRDFCSCSSAFIRGYAAAYRAAYGEGYNLGARELRCRGTQRIVLHHRHGDHHRGSRW